MFGWSKFRRSLVAIGMLVLVSASLASASATLFLEEPYGKLGFFTATGHAAVYLSGVCAETPLVLRPCRRGELGAVISRYDGVGGYDWIAVPLIPYLYAVEKTDDIPLFVDPKVVNFLRDQYRRKHLEAIAPDLGDGEIPGGNWYELVGSAYNRTAYAFEIETSKEQDEALIRAYNTAPNRSHFRTVSHNCADFAKDVINFYYPKALHRSVVADVGMTTPKQMAKTMIRYTVRHPELQFSRMVIPQIPGSMPRSTTVHGVVESFFKSKKYIVPSAVASPIFAGCVFAVFVGAGARHFDPARDALVFAADGERELPMDREDRQTRQKELEGLLAEADAEGASGNIRKEWARLESKAQLEFDAEDRPVLLMQVGERLVRVGISADNIFSSSAPSQLVRELIEARLEAELRRTATPTVSERDFARDWKLLQQARNVDGKELAGNVR